MSFMDSHDPIYRTMTAAEQEAHDKLPLEEKEYQRYVFRMRIFPPYDQKILTREEFYEKFKKDLSSASGPPAATPSRTTS